MANAPRAIVYSSRALSAASEPHSSASSAGDARLASMSLLVSATLFAIMALLARLVSRTIPGAQVALVRFSLGTAVVLGAWLLFRVELRPHRWGWLVARGIFGGGAVSLYFVCIEHLGVGRATLLNYTSPVWALIFGRVLLGEKPRGHVTPALLLTLVGVALIVGHRAGGWGLGAWDLVAIFSSVLSGLAVTSIRAVRRPLEHGPPIESFWSVFASFTFLGAVATLPTVLQPFGQWIAPTPREWLILLAMGFTSIWAQIIMTRALKHVTAPSMGIIHQITVVLSVLGGIIFFGEAMTVQSGVGSILTVVGVLWVVCLE